MTDVAISCEGLWKRYRLYHQRATTLKGRLTGQRTNYETLWALQNIDLEVARGSCWGIVGRNGSGKSTLLKVVAGVLPANRGSVHVDGTISALIELGVGFHPELTGRENLYLGGALLGRSKRDIRARYDSIVDFSGLGSFMDAPLKTYSTGMYARLAFSLASSVEADILLVDEVLAVGDESFQVRCRERIDQLWGEGRTILIVAHSVLTIRKLCSHALWLDGGTVRSAGAVRAVTDAYEATFDGPAIDVGVAPGSRP